MTYSLQPGQALVTSKSFWGGTASVVAGLIGVLQGLAPGDLQTTITLVASILSGLGGLWAIWGRVAATTQITGVITK